jgi:HPt (histidine-containing phosphotransfer) domain-containing protein
MAAIFLAEMPRRLAAARGAIRAGDAAGAVLPAHGMKSSSAQLGATALAELCADLERSARAGDLARAAALLDAAGAELARFSAWLAGAVPGAAAAEHGPEP